MGRHVAFLRAVNVGGHIVKMDRLRRLFEELRFGGVETFIASGNVIFEAPNGRAAGIERTIEAHLAGALGYEVATFVRTTGELAAIAAGVPAPAARALADGHSLFVAFLKSPPPVPVRRRVEAFRSAVDEPFVQGREIYWVRRGPFADSVLARDPLGKGLGLATTLRNITTVRRLAAKYRS
jgi:uncharacterized protein (DUF1697 family)